MDIGEVNQRCSPKLVSLKTFNVDVTPEIGDPIAYGEAVGIDDPLYARGLVLSANALPIVIVSVDWIGIANAGNDNWRERLADAAGTTPERVAVHTVHQHQTPWFDSDAIGIVRAHGALTYRINPVYAEETIERVADAVADATSNLEPVTHVHTGVAEVENVASNRQLIYENGEIAHVRFSSEPQRRWRDAPEGLIDPEVTIVGFWREDEAVAALSYYACHPQSYYRDERVTCDFPGIARRIAEEELEVPLIHFCGAAGNVTPGKYNDGSPENRTELACRLTDGITRAWSSGSKSQINADEVNWESTRVELPPSPDHKVDSLAADLADEPSYRTARKLAWLVRCERGHAIPITCLRLGEAIVLHMPGELFVEYQLAAKRFRPDRTVAMAAYGDLGPMYIGTRDAYPMGGYEVEKGSLVAPNAESTLVDAMRELLNAEDTDLTPSDITAEKVRLEREES